jgi:hypothetical protein
MVVGRTETRRSRDGGGHVPPRAKIPNVTEETTGEKVMLTFRMPLELAAFVKVEALKGGRDVTAHVNRWLEGFRSYFGLPSAAQAVLEADRKALGLDRFEYLLHLCYQRLQELRDKPPGFDGAPQVERRRR